MARRRKSKQSNDILKYSLIGVAVIAVLFLLFNIAPTGKYYETPEYVPDPSDFEVDTFVPLQDGSLPDHDDDGVPDKLECPNLFLGDGDEVDIETIAAFYSDSGADESKAEPVTQIVANLEVSVGFPKTIDMERWSSTRTKRVALFDIEDRCDDDKPIGECDIGSETYLYSMLGFPISVPRNPFVPYVPDDSTIGVPSIGYSADTRFIEVVKIEPNQATTEISQKFELSKECHVCGEDYDPDSWYYHPDRFEFGTNGNIILTHDSRAPDFLIGDGDSEIKVMLTINGKTKQYILKEGVRSELDINHHELASDDSMPEWIEFSLINQYTCPQCDQEKLKFHPMIFLGTTAIVGTETKTVNDVRIQLVDWDLGEAITEFHPTPSFEVTEALIWTKDTAPDSLKSSLEDGKSYYSISFDAFASEPLEYPQTRIATDSVFVWDFGDRNAVTTDYEIEHIFDALGEHTISLMVNTELEKTPDPRLSSIIEQKLTISTHKVEIPEVSIEVSGADIFNWIHEVKTFHALDLELRNCLDGNKNGIPDIIEPMSDYDGDGLPDHWETEYGFPWDSADHNGDGIPAAEEDPDDDELTNIAEFDEGTDPTKADTDGDGFNDGDEIKAGTDPLNPLDPPEPPTNNPPVITSSPMNSEQEENTEFKGKVTATDQDGDTLTYLMSIKLKNPQLAKALLLTIPDLNTGEITGTLPDVSQDTTYTITVTVSDGTDEANVDFDIIVTDIPPPAVPTPPVDDTPPVIVLLDDSTANQCTMEVTPEESRASSLFILQIKDTGGTILAYEYQFREIELGVGQTLTIDKPEGSALCEGFLWEDWSGTPLADNAQYTL